MSRSILMTIFCEVTSSAEDGSSAISTLGERMTATAMTVRCFMPPESSTGYFCSTSAGSPSVSKLFGVVVDHLLGPGRIVRPHDIADEVDDLARGVERVHRRLGNIGDLASQDRLAHIIGFMPEMFWPSMMISPLV
jgi:hypothetical protein